MNKSQAEEKIVSLVEENPSVLKNENLRSDLAFVLSKDALKRIYRGWFYEICDRFAYNQQRQTIQAQTALLIEIQRCVDALTAILRSQSELYQAQIDHEIAKVRRDNYMKRINDGTIESIVNDELSEMKTDARLKRRKKEIELEKLEKGISVNPEPQKPKKNKRQTKINSVDEDIRMINDLRKKKEDLMSQTSNEDEKRRIENFFEREIMDIREGRR